MFYIRGCLHQKLKDDYQSSHTTTFSFFSALQHRVGGQALLLKPCAASDWANLRYLDHVGNVEAFASKVRQFTSKLARCGIKVPESDRASKPFATWDPDDHICMSTYILSVAHHNKNLRPVGSKLIPPEAYNREGGKVQGNGTKGKAKKGKGNGDGGGGNGSGSHAGGGKSKSKGRARSEAKSKGNPYDKTKNTRHYHTRLWSQLVQLKNLSQKGPLLFGDRRRLVHQPSAAASFSPQDKLRTSGDPLVRDLVLRLRLSANLMSDNSRQTIRLCASLISSFLQRTDPENHDPDIVKAHVLCTRRLEFDSLASLNSLPKTIAQGPPKERDPTAVKTRTKALSGFALRAGVPFELLCHIFRLRRAVERDLSTYGHESDLKYNLKSRAKRAAAVLDIYSCTLVCRAWEPAASSVLWDRVLAFGSFSSSIRLGRGKELAGTMRFLEIAPQGRDGWRVPRHRSMRFFEKLEGLRGLYLGLLDGLEAADILRGLNRASPQVTALEIGMVHQDRGDALMIDNPSDLAEVASTMKRLQFLRMPTWAQPLAVPAPIIDMLVSWDPAITSFLRARGSQMRYLSLTCTHADRSVHVTLATHTPLMEAIDISITFNLFPSHNDQPPAFTPENVAMMTDLLLDTG
ncbi:hypothetical protein BDK51DRAFT_47262 [Blyttiomyces helicus]|uniref:Uncharacterized protein n=1 Tax=Blyttiomyces helicus TaxID=388810 RepID=A0A4P9VWB1_9FUNG|nr:hypothetical protein BDK51DRAFT_47262 [Blyttiomyces helicus]|eukprot:RKO83989.1 hypothetical protein BDK51DRAFT_47262 [Blyttiomyces helicus]